LRGWHVRALTLLLAGVPAFASAQTRQVIELEPVTPYFSTRGANRTEVAVVGYTYGHRFDSLIPYFGGGVSFFSVQARAGITWLPGDLDDTSLMVRLEARPQLLLTPCVEPFIAGNLGVGIRWSIELGDPGEPGTALYLLPQFTGGNAWLRDGCGTIYKKPFEATVLFGGTLSGGFDW
jgi:hypothetical protein